MSDQNLGRVRHHDTRAAALATVCVLVCALLIVGTYGLLVAAATTGAFSLGGMVFVVILTNAAVIGFLFYRASRPDLSRFDRSLLLIDGASSAHRLRCAILLISAAAIVPMQVVLLVLYSGLGGAVASKLYMGFAAVLPLATAKAVLLLAWTRRLYLSHGARYRFSAIFLMMFGPQSQADIDEGLWRDLQPIQNRNLLSNSLIVLSAFVITIFGVLSKKYLG